MSQDQIARLTALIDKITIVRDERALSAVLDGLSPGHVQKPVRLAFVNAHAANLCWKDEDFFSDLMSCDILFRDGAGMKILYTMMGREPGLNLNGTDLIPKILELYKGNDVALMGTASPYLEKAAALIEAKGAKPVTTIDGFQDDGRYVEALKDKHVALTILAMGMPKQERVAAKIVRAASSPSLIVCGGAILDFIAGKVARAPEIFRKTGTEWVYRLAQEPRRLFGRYVIGNGVFLWHAAHVAAAKPARAGSDGMPRRPKILHVVRQFHPAIGGLESYVLSMAKHQKDSGYDPEILTLDKIFHGGGDRLPAHDIVEGLTVRRVPFIGKQRFFFPLISPLYFRKFDVVHVHNTDMFYDYVSLTAALFGQKCFATTHGGFFHTKDFSLVKKVYFNVITRVTSRFYKAIFAISQNDFDTFEHVNDNVILQHNAVEPLGDEISSGQDFLYIGRLAAHKNVGKVIEVCAALFKTHNVPGKLHIVGPAWDVSIEDLKKVAERESIAERVVFYGAATREQMQDAARQCGYFMSASAFEGFGMSMLEAMSVGMVPFVQPNESFKELVGDARVGLCTDFQNVTAAAAAIAPVLAMVTPDDRIRAQAFSRRFAWQGLVENTARVYALNEGDTL